MASRLRKQTLRWLIPIHRYLGLGMSLILLLWFASGIVMMFEGYPRTPDHERMAWLNPLDTSELAVAPSQGLETLGLEEPEGLRINQPGGRPRLHAMDEEGQWHSVFADTGEPAPALDRQQASERAEALADADVAAVTLLKGPDQWTVNNHVQAPTPLWRVALADEAGTHLYLSRPTGEVIHSTTFHERVWGYAGPVVHWIYPTQLKNLSGFWRQLVLWLAGLGTLACLSGVVLGLMLMRRNKRQGGLSPFRGWFRWHHYLGLIFGVLATTWVFSGLLSMAPFYWYSADRDPGITQPLGHTSPGSHADVAAPSTIATLAGQAPHELQLHRFHDRTYYRAMDGAGNKQLHTTRPGIDVPTATGQLPADVIRAALTSVEGGADLDGLTRQTSYDAYYYPGRTARIGGEGPALPVYRADYTSGARLYIDPATGSVRQHSTPLNRLNRWLYSGLHSLDFPVLNPGSWFWYGLVLTLMSGGTVLCVTGLWLSIRYFRRRRKA